MTNGWRSDLIDEIQTLIVESEPDVVEEAEVAPVPESRRRADRLLLGLICTVETDKDKLKVTFAKGASLADPDTLFNASLDADTRRAIDIFDGGELDEDAFVELIREAVAFNRARRSLG